VLTLLGIVCFLAIPAVALVWLAAVTYLEHRADRVPILLYHRLVRKADVDAGRVSDAEPIWIAYDTVFAEHMRHLHEGGWTTLDLDELLEIRAGRRPHPGRAVVVTFDDGYASNYTLAFPVLRANRQKATIFVVPEPDEHTRGQVAGVDGFLTAEQLREMTAAGISIQSHTLTHAILTALPAERVRFELAESRRRIEAVTGRPVRHLAIPRAGYSRAIRAEARRQGYATVCCNNKGTANGLSDPLALPRLVIDRDTDAAEFARCLEPRTALVLRIVGNLKRVPERLGGARFHRRVRDVLYGSPLAPLFTTRNLKRLVSAAAFVYLGGGAVFVWRLLAA